MARNLPPKGPPPSELLSKESREELKHFIQMKMHVSLSGWSIGFVILASTILILVVKAFVLIQNVEDFNVFSQQLKGLLEVVTTGSFSNKG